MSAEDRRHINNLLQQHQRRLRLLEQRAATAGMNVPPEVIIEIEDLRSTIADLQLQLEGETQISDSAPTLPRSGLASSRASSQQSWVVPLAIALIGVSAVIVTVWISQGSRRVSESPTPTIPLAIIVAATSSTFISPVPLPTQISYSATDVVLPTTLAPTAIPTFESTPTSIVVTPPSSTATFTPVNPTAVSTASAPITVTPAKQNIRILFKSTQNDKYNVKSMNPDGSGQQTIYSVQDSDLGIVSSPDGTKIAYASRDSNNKSDVYIIGAGGTMRNLTQNPADDGDPAWSPDGEQIAFESNRDVHFTIYIMKADGSNSPTPLPSDGNSYSPAWSPKDSKIAFDCDCGNGIDIYVVDWEYLSSPQRLTSSGGTNYDPTWSPDGSKIAFVSERDGNKEIYVMNAGGTNPINLTNNPKADYEPTWLPDGRIVFVSERDGNEEIYIMDADGSNPTNLTNSPEAHDTQPSWSISR